MFLNEQRYEQNFILLGSEIANYTIGLVKILI